jgi:hypothetical protein
MVFSRHLGDAALVRATRYGRHCQSRAPHADGCLDPPVPIRGNKPDIRDILDGATCRDTELLLHIGTDAARTRAMRVRCDLYALQLAP